MFRQHKAILEEKLKEKYTYSKDKNVPSNIEIRQKLYDRLLECADVKEISDLTVVPLQRRPPENFQILRIEFPLRKTNPEDLKLHQDKFNDFLAHQKQLRRKLNVKDCFQISKEVYKHARFNGDPQKPLQLASDPIRVNYFIKLQKEQWEIIRIYGDEKPSQPRAYIAISPLNLFKKTKIIIGFMGAMDPPSPQETWWTNKREGQKDTWRDINFSRSETEHTGIKAYCAQIIEKIKYELCRRIPSDKLMSLDFEMTGHSTGGVLAISAAQDFRKTFLNCRITVIAFATPNFMNQAECEQLRTDFPNDSENSVYNLMAWDDPAIGIYGENLYQPWHTIFLKPEQYAGYSFIGIHAASAGITKWAIKNHFPANYQTLVDAMDVPASPESGICSRI